MSIQEERSDDTYDRVKDQLAEIQDELDEEYPDEELDVFENDRDGEIFSLKVTLNTYTD